MTDMHSFIDDLLAETPEGQREAVRARLRVNVAEDLLLQLEQAGMSKAQLAEALGVSRSAVTQALTGSRNMSLNTLADIADALKLTVRVQLQAANAGATAAMVMMVPTTSSTRPIVPSFRLVAPGQGEPIIVRAEPAGTAARPG